MKGKLICFIGVIGSGKTYQCSLKEKMGNCVKHDFADSLRSLASFSLGVNVVEDYDLFKESLITKNFNNYEAITGRQYLQNLAQGLKKVTHNPAIFGEMWVSGVKESLDTGVNVVCADMRFKEEYLIAKQLGAVFVFCNYISSRYDSNSEANNHVSEAFARKVLQSNLWQDGEVIETAYLDELIKEL